jgi:hypothetical protein
LVDATNGKPSQGAEMPDILDFIVRFCSFLWLEARYRIVDSDVTLSFGGDAWLIVASDSLQLTFVRDRGQLFLDFQGPTSASSEWYSVDVVYRLLTGDKRDSAELDEVYARFVSERLLDIESSFSAGHMPETKKRLVALERLRAKEMFG